MRVVEAGRDAAAGEVDALGRDRRAIALAHVDAARNARAGNGDCACPRQAWVACEHRTALEDHRRRVATIAARDRRCPLATPSRDELEPRLERFARGLEAAGLDAALLVVAADVYHLAGTAQNAHLVVPVEGEPLLLVRRDLERARAESALAAIEPLASLRGLEPALAAARARAGRGDRARARRAARRELPPLRGAAARSPARRRACRRSGPRGRRRARGSSNASVPPASRARRRMQALPELVRVGRAEADLLSDARGRDARARPRGHRPLPRPQQRVLLRAGARGAVGRRARARPTRRSQARASRRRRDAGPSRRPLAAGDAVVVDVTGLAGGYVSDQTRTVFLGDPDPRLVAAYDTCRAILRACEELLVPGTPASALYERGLEVAAEAGLEEHYMGFGPDRVRFVGHAIGLELNEAPALARGVQTPLVDGRRDRRRAQAAVPGARCRRHREQLRRARRRARAAHARRRRSDPGRAVTAAIDADLYRRLFSELAAIGAGSDGLEPPCLGPARGRRALMVPGDARASSASRSSRTARGTSGRSSRARARPHSCVRDHTWTPCSTAARTTVRSAWSRRSSRSRRCAGRRAGHRRPLAVGCMVDEEGPRFDAAIFGSRMLCGELEIEPLLARRRSRREHARRSRGRTGRHGAVARRDARVARTHRALARGARRAGRRHSPRFLPRSAWPRGSRRASAGGRRSTARRTMRERRRWRGAGTRSCAAARAIVAAESLAARRAGRRRDRRPHRGRPGRQQRDPGARGALPRRPGARRRGPRTRARRGLLGGRVAAGYRSRWRRESLDPGSRFDDGLRDALARAAAVGGRSVSRPLGLRGP